MTAKDLSMSPLQRLAVAAAPVRGDLSLAGGATVISALFWIAQAIIVAGLFQDLLSGVVSGSRAFWSALVFVAVGGVRAGLDFWADRKATEAANRVLAKERRKLVEAAALRSSFDPERLASAAIAALAAEKLDALRPFLIRYRAAYLRTLVVPLVFVLVAGSQSWVVAGIFLVAGPLIPMFMVLVGLAAQEASEKQMDEIASLNDLLMERLQALVDIRLLDAGGAMISGFRGLADTLRERTMAVLRIAFMSSAVLELFAALGVAMVAVFVGFSLLGDIRFGAYATPLTIGQGVFLLMLAPAYFQPLRDVAAAWHDRAAALAVARDLLNIEETPKDLIVGTGQSAVALPGKPDIAVRGLHLCLKGNDVIAYDDFNIIAGETVALVGPSGVGKSLLLAALAGLVRPCGGEIQVAGQILDEDTADGWRQRLSWLPQKLHFFSKSLRWNLLIGQSGREQAAIDQALDQAAATGLVARLPRGLLTRLGEVGSGVSGGEARRLMVARATLEGRGVILADEPTADLDAETAHIVTEGLLRLAESGATVIVATHDSNLAARMDRRIQLGEAGR